MSGQEAVDELKRIAEEYLPQPLLGLALKVFDDPRFIRGYGAAVDGNHAHHAYNGGLPIHTLEVTTIALAAAKSSYLTVNIPILVTAAIWHDYCKVLDYDYNGYKTTYRKLVRHLSGSHAAFCCEVVSEDIGIIDSITQMNIEHCILAHHGRQEWGSPVEPQTVEASILHYADMLSMQYGANR